MIGQLRSGGGGGRLDKPGAKPSKKKLGKNRLFLPFSCPFVSVPFSMKKKIFFFAFLFHAGRDQVTQRRLRTLEPVYHNPLSNGFVGFSFFLFVCVSFLFFVKLQST